MSQFTERRERRQHELERNFVRMPHRASSGLNPKRNRSSIILPEFHGISFRLIGKQRRSVYHQLDGSIELADACICEVHFSEGMHGWPDFKPMRVEHLTGCPIDEHRMEAQRRLREDAA